MPSRAQACEIQAMFRGASSSAPRWSVVEETGKVTACSRGTISRPPAEATAVKTARTRKPRHREGSRASSEPLLGRGVSPPRYAGPITATIVRSSTIAPATRNRSRPGLERPELRKASSEPRSCLAGVGAQSRRAR